MQVKGTANPALVEVPVRGATPPLFETIGAPVATLRVDLPLTAEELVAALFDSGADPVDLADDEWVRAQVLIVLLTDGLPSVQERAKHLEELPAADRRLLAFCRRRVADAFGLSAPVRAAAPVLAGVA